MIDRHWHWKFSAYNGTVTDRMVMWAVTVEVVGYPCESEARMAAEDIVRREHYELASVWECSSCGFRQEVADSFRTVAEAH